MNNIWRTVEIMAEGYHLLCVQSPKVNMTRFFLNTAIKVSLVGEKRMNDNFP